MTEAPAVRSPAPDRPSPGAPEGPAEEGGAGAYARGFGDGVRSALREVMSWASRGHTPAELKVLAQSRLSHLDEEVALKRRTLLSAPQSIPLESLLRVRGPESAPGFPPLAPGYTYLFLEERPLLARRFLAEALPRLGGALGLTRLPGELRAVAPREALEVLYLGVESPSDPGVEGASNNVSGLTSRVQDFLGRDGSSRALYLEAFDYLTVWNDFEPAMKFLYWASAEVHSHRGVLLVSVDPDSLSRVQLRTLERDFNHRIKLP